MFATVCLWVKQNSETYHQHLNSDSPTKITYEIILERSNSASDSGVHNKARPRTI